MTTRIGLLGASRISRAAIIAPANELEAVEVTSIAASSPERAADFAAEHGIASVEPGYMALIESDAVDLVYNGLPPSKHMRWSIAALEAGKHVLCEKPFALDAKQARAMNAAAARSGNTLIEAFHYRFHPLMDRVAALLRGGEIGTITRLASHFNVPVAYRDGELRYSPELGGGAMMDLGCYPLHWVRMATGEEPSIVSAEAERHASGVDVAMRALLEFPGGVRAAIESSMSETLPGEVDAELVVVGERGTLTVINPLVPHIGHEIRIEKDGQRHSEQVEGNSTYWHQLNRVAQILRGEAERLLPPSDAVNNMAALDAIYAAAGMR